MLEFQTQLELLLWGRLSSPSALTMNLRKRKPQALWLLRPRRLETPFLEIGVNKRLHNLPRSLRFLSQYPSPMFLGRKGWCTPMNFSAPCCFGAWDALFWFKLLRSLQRVSIHVPYNYWKQCPHCKRNSRKTTKSVLRFIVVNIHNVNYRT